MSATRLSDPICPVCGRLVVSSIMNVGADEAAQAFVLREGNPTRHEQLTGAISALWEQSQCSILSCKHCEFGFAWPYIAGDAEFYNLAYPHVGYPRNKWDYSRTVLALEGCDTKGRHALEVASGYGYFLDKICDRFFPVRSVTATEFNEDSAAMLRGKGYSVVMDDVRSEAFAEKTYDFVFLFQVVEHLDRLDDLFKRLRDLINVGGSIFIAVPNSRRVAFQENNGSLIDYPPNHIGRWTETSFKVMSQRFDFEIVSYEIEPFSAWKYLIQDLIFSHRQRAQDPNSLANRIRRLPRSKIQRTLELCVIILHAPFRVSTWFRAFRLRDGLGDSAWVHLRPSSTQSDVSC